MNKDLFLGIDIGSVSVKAALVDPRKSLITDSYTRITGEPVHTLREELARICRLRSAGTTQIVGVCN